MWGGACLVVCGVDSERKIWGQGDNYDSCLIWPLGGLRLRCPHHRAQVGEGWLMVGSGGWCQINGKVNV